MGKTGRWIRKLLTGKKVNAGTKDLGMSEKYIASTDDVHNSDDNGYHHHHRHNHRRPTTPVPITQPTTPREKRRWSFRRSSAATAARQDQGSAVDEPGSDSKSAVVAAAKAAAAVIQMTAGGEYGRGSAVEEAAALRIQSVFRSHLARKALNALKGLVKLQALVRGHLVRKQATATLRCMQALVSVQSRALAQRLKMSEEIKHIDQSPLNNNHRKSTQQEYNKLFRNSNQDFVEENIKIVEMDLGDYKPATKPRSSSYSNQTEHRLSTQYRTPTKQDNIKNQFQNQVISPSPSAITDTSPRTCSNHFEEYNSFNTAQSSPKCYSAQSKPEPPRIPIPYPRSEYAESLYSEYAFYPSYMANTESSRAKARSHSAPKQRPVETTLERQPSIKRRPSLEGRNVPRAVRMQRSSSQVGAAAQNYHYPWSVKLDRSAVSLKDSECGSTSTVLTNANYCRSLVGFEVQGGRN